MIKVKMIKDFKGSEDGVVIKEFKSGFEYEIPDSLAEDFKILGVIEPIKKKKIDMETPENPSKRDK